MLNVHIYFACCCNVAENQNAFAKDFHGKLQKQVYNDIIDEFHFRSRKPK